MNDSKIKKLIDRISLSYIIEGEPLQKILQTDKDFQSFGYPEIYEFLNRLKDNLNEEKFGELGGGNTTGNNYYQFLRNLEYTFGKYKIEEIKEKLNTIQNRTEKLNFLNRELTDFLESDPNTEVFNLKEFLEFEIQYLKNYVEDDTDNNSKSRISAEQQVLLLHYLGIMDIKIPIGKKGKLFSYLLDRTPKKIENSIRYFQNKSSEDNPYTIKNLKIVLEIFSELKLTDQMKRIENDLNILTLEQKK